MYEKTDIICIPSWSIGFKKRLGITNEEYIKTFYVYGAYVSRSFVLVSGNLNTTFASFGRSLMVSPIHGVLQEGSRDKEELLIQELDLDEVKKAREFDVFWQPKVRII